LALGALFASTASAEKKKLEDELKEEQHKNQDADTLLATVSASKANYFIAFCICVTESYI
jgi:hypothetical protein